MEEAKSLLDVREVMGECTRCTLCKSRTNVVFGDGKDDTRLMFVGEAPGRVEDAQGLPFVGPAGKLLDQLLEGIGIARQDVYITNVVKCRPPGNRDPLPAEIQKCFPFLEGQIKTIRPKLVCSLGRIAAGIMLDRTVQISKEHGRKLPGPGYFNVPVFHPAAALRAAAAMESIEEDFRKLKEYLEQDEPPPRPPAPEPEQMGLF